MKRRLGPLDWLLVVVLMTSWGVFFARGMDEGLHTGMGRVYVGLYSAAGAHAYPTVRGVTISGWNAGLEAGDEILAVAGEDLAGRSAAYVYSRATRVAAEQGAAPLRVRRGGVSFETRFGLTPSSNWWLHLAVSAGNLLLALLLLIRVPSSHLTRRYFVAMWAYAGATAISPLMVAPRSVDEAVLRCFLPAIGPALTVRLAQDFALSARPIPRAYGAVAVLVFLLNFALYVLLGFAPDWGVSLVWIGALGAGCQIAGCVGGLLRAYLRSGPLERRQARWVMLGGYVALVALLFNVGALSLGAPLGISSIFMLTSWIALPTGIVVSIVGYGWGDVDRLISATASYTVVGLVVLGAALALVPALAHASAPLLGLDAGTEQWALTLALVGAAIPVHQFLRPRIDRRLFAERHERMLGLERLLDELGRATSVEELTQLCGERLAELLAPESIAVYARQETAFTPLFVRGRAAPPAFEADSPLLHTLARRARPLAADSSELDAFDRAALETLGTAVVVPIRQGDAIVAITCLGPKRSGDIYTPEEIAHLMAVANRCSEMLVKLGDEVVIREAREMQQALRRYVPGVVAAELDGGRPLEAAEREVSVLFVDMRGYTRFAEQRAAEEIFSTLNAYTETVSRLVHEHGGAIVEFHGDGLMAVFGAPRPLERKERAAVLAARDVVEALAGSIEVGIGIATGPAFVGNIRAADRLIWSAVGNTTNLAARLQALTRQLGAAIAIDASTHAAAGPVAADFARHPEIAIRGRSDKHEVWALAPWPAIPRLPGWTAKSG